MRRQILHDGAGRLSYEIREIVAAARLVESHGKRILWENIGDPVQKGASPAEWIIESVSRLASDPRSYSYTDSQGNPETRAFLAEMACRRGGCRISGDEIIFFNGLGDAVSTIFGLLKREARVIGPTPAYSTHSSAEASHSGYEHLVYPLDPQNGWLPDLDDLENKVRYNDSIAGILIINPNNPTGKVYPRAVLERIAGIAEKYGLFIISDETYGRVVFPDTEFTFLSEVIGSVPGISMQSISKEYPWPGARCGWVEVYNREKDADFSDYIGSIINAKRLEVCSTNLPQLSIPLIMGDPRYSEHIDRQSRILAERAFEAESAFAETGGVSFIRPEAGLYCSVIFEKGVLNQSKLTEIADAEIAACIAKLSEGAAADKKFVYNLLGRTGICVVPMSGFYSKLEGFRFTLLEQNGELRKQIYSSLASEVGMITGCLQI